MRKKRTVDSGNGVCKGPKVEESMGVFGDFYMDVEVFFKEGVCVRIWWESSSL